MAVVFISPKKRQKVFFMGITAGFLIFLIVVSFLVFLSKPMNYSSTVLVFNKPKVNIDMSVFNSNQFKNLLPLTIMQLQYSYTATDKNNKKQTGFISAASEAEARTILQAMQLAISEIKEVEVGRDDPFVPYYQAVVAQPTAVATKK